ncbi:MAG TPA: RNA polymerase sigma factor [Kofleriaceae bacterium]|nr:RNA polymerase sigma factor [Kofleriaceae bacterium]
MMSSRASDAGGALDFEEVYERHLDFVWRTLAAAGVPESRLEDAAQDVFVIVHGKLAEFEGRSKLTTWLYGIARHVALEHVRRMLRERARERAMAEQARDDSQTPEEETRGAQARRLLLDLLDRLDPDKREVFALVEIEQVPVREVARMLDIKENTVWSRLRLARREFEKQAARLRARDRETTR